MNKANSPDPLLESMVDQYINENKNSLFNSLNFKITNEEILQATNKLAPGKSSGVDGILNEMLKIGIHKLLPSLHKLFNIILTSGTFPTTWGSNTLSPLHKTGDRNACDNYRGIAVGSNLSKLFCSILHNRISIFCEQNHIIPPNQIGYKKKTRTTDHILTLKNIIEKSKDITFLHVLWTLSQPLIRSGVVL